MASSTRRLRNRNLLNTTKKSNTQVKSRKLTNGRREREEQSANSPVPLLDMLAEVASATLESDPTFYSGNKYKSPKSNDRSTYQSEILTLDQIRVLSDRMLLEMFSELVSDEMRRQYSYKCFLMPDKCSEMFRSFGNEARARLQMKSHLLTHIAELLAEANGPGKSHRQRFTAEPLASRKRRLEGGMTGRKRKKVHTYQNMSISKKILRAKNVIKRKGIPVKETKKLGTKANSPEDDFSNSASEGSDSASDDNQSPDDDSDSENNSPIHQVQVQSRFQKGRTKIKPKPTARRKTEQEIFKESCVKRDRLQNGSAFHPVNGKCTDLENSEVVMDYAINEIASNEEGDEYSIKKIVDTMSQPQHDHSYTSIMGKKKGLESFHLEFTVSSDEESEHEDKDSPRPKRKRGFLYETPQLIVATPTFPYIYVPLLPNIAHITEIDSGNHNAFHKSSMSDLISLRGSSKSPQTGESEDSDSSSDGSTGSGNHTIGRQHKKNNSMSLPKDGTTQWEKKMALQYIRAFRTKKKDERGPLVCRICKNKTFTAQATLMYHYRSHAGIKPFICTICGATFTRQHSLNYHMLIHNNKSRFVCGDCGRTFRHPSHYKEHLRRHTGETPYECGDCGQRFKTRNTYKRHLKTRHGKILTAQGIITMSTEEFFKVRTNPRKKIPRIIPSAIKKDQETQWPEQYEEYVLVSC